MKTKLLIGLFAICGVALGQNIVPNNSFETNTSYPSAGNQLNLCTGWSNVNGTYFPSFSTGSPDYYHSSGSGGVKLPNTTYATVNANTGSACAGITTWNDNETNFREYMSIKLTDPGLVVGKIYSISLYLTNGTNCTYKYQTNNIGIRFSLNNFSQTGWQPINVIPQLEVASVVNAPNWQLFSFQFTADSAYQYITIGNFKTDANTTHIQFTSGSNPYGYYYIDDVSVTDVTGIENYDLQSHIDIFPNPLSAQTVLRSDIFLNNATLTVDNCFGQTVKQIKNISGQTVTLSRDNLPSGLYFVRLTEENKTIAADKLVILDK